MSCQFIGKFWTSSGTSFFALRIIVKWVEKTHPNVVHTNWSYRTVCCGTKKKLDVTRTKLRQLEIAYPFFASQKSVKAGFSANSLSQTIALLYEGAELEGASSHSGRRTFLTNLANKGTAIHLLKTLAGHRSIQTTAAYLYSSPAQLRAVVELV